MQRLPESSGPFALLNPKVTEPLLSEFYGSVTVHLAQLWHGKTRNYGCVTIIIETIQDGEQGSIYPVLPPDLFFFFSNEYALRCHHAF